MVAALQLASPPGGGGKGGGGGTANTTSECGGGTRGFIDDCKIRHRAYTARAGRGIMYHYRAHLSLPRHGRSVCPEELRMRYRKEKIIFSIRA